jgi:hypothetical protein
MRLVQIYYNLREQYMLKVAAQLHAKVVKAGFPAKSGRQKNGALAHAVSLTSVGGR